MEDFCLLCYLEKFPDAKLTQEFVDERACEFFGEEEEIALCGSCRYRVTRWLKKNGSGIKKLKAPKKTDAHNI